MAYLNTTSAPTLTDRIGGVVTALVARYRRHQLYRETFNGLSALTNRELHDLGLNRSELRRVAADAANR